MAAPKRNRTKEHHAKTIASIRASQLLNRLTAFALNEKETAVNKDKGEEDQRVVMSAAQVTAALGVVKKAIPDLSATTIDADVRNKHEFEGLSESELDDKIKDMTND